MNIANTEKIKCAVPSKGRLSEPSIDLLHRAGYSFRTKGRNLYATRTNADIIFNIVRADDIPVLVETGVVDLGITGSDLILERRATVREIMPLGFGRCRLCVAVKDDFPGKDLSVFQGKNIATSFPRITEGFFRERNIGINCIEMNGSVEIMVDLHLAEAIVDIVETGDSLRDNNLKIFAEIGSYETVLIANGSRAGNPLIEQIRRRIEGILIADQYSMLEYNIREERFKDAEIITPGYESPTVSRLDQENWLAVKVMVLKKDVVAVMDSLEQIGATAIIETSVRNCRL
jgi:ATP phosphoribosyltransferase